MAMAVGFFVLGIFCPCWWMVLALCGYFISTERKNYCNPLPIAYLLLSNKDFKGG